MSSFWLPLLFGFGTGILSAWGVGGGTLLLLCMTLFLQVEQEMAQGINLLFFLPTAGVGLIFHAKNGYINKAIWKKAAFPGVPAAVAASFAAMQLDTEALRKPFGVFLLWAGGSLLWKTWKNSKEGR